VESLSSRALLRHRLQVRKFFWRNYLAHGVEGGLYMAGLVFLSESTVLPVMVKGLGGPVWLVTLIPILMAVGSQLPQLLVAHWIEKIHWVKGLVMTTGVLQRLPYLLAGLTLLYLAPSHPGLALVAVALCPLVCGLASGFSATAWWELVAKTIPENRRSSLWAVRNIIAMALGAAAAGPCVHFALERYPGAAGYGVLHLMTLAFMAASYLVFSLIRETNLPPRPHSETPTLRANLKAVPSLLAGNRQFRRYVASQAVATGFNIAGPFMAIHALEVLGKDASFVGVFVTAQMIGGAAGNLAGGYVGDRIGGKFPLLAARVALVGVCAAMALAGNLWQFVAAFAVLGAAGSFGGVGSMTLALEICPLQKRSTYLAILASTSVVTSLGIAGLSTLAWGLSGGRFGWMAALAAAATAGAAGILWRLREPRRISTPEADHPQC
jgi:MFS family permease